MDAGNAYSSISALAVEAQTIEQAPTYTTKKSNVTVNLFYDYALPLGSFKNDLFKSNSPRGFNADILYWVQPKWGVGGSFGYQDFYQKNARNVYKLQDGSDISAVLTHSMQTIPIVVKGMYMPSAGSTSMLQPYLSAGAGVKLVTFSEYLGEFSSANNSSARFTAQAGAGIKIALGKSDKAGFLLGANYNYTPYNKFDIKSISNVNLQVGFQFKLK